MAENQDRNALAFKIPESEKKPERVESEDEDDSFYDLTLEELRALHSLNQKHKALNDMLLIREKREEEEKKIRPPPPVYTESVIRIEFPESRMVLQGKFKPEETIGDVKEFVRDHIKEPGAEFELFISPPKVVLRDESTLKQLKLVPTAKVYIGINAVANGQMISDRTTCVPFTSAQEAANVVRSKKQDVRQPSPESTPGPSTNPQPSTSRQTTDKVPKWFRTKK